MIVQWRFKVCECFAIYNDEIVRGDYLYGYRGGRATPSGMRVYRPSRRQWDFVDYTGKYKKTELDIKEITCILEVLGIIKFVGSSNGQQELRG